MPTLFAVSFIRHHARRGLPADKIKARLHEFHPYEVITDDAIARAIETDPARWGYFAGEQHDKLGNTRGDRTGEPHRRHHG